RVQRDRDAHRERAGRADCRRLRRTWCARSRRRAGRPTAGARRPAAGRGARAMTKPSPLVTAACCLLALLAHGAAAQGERPAAAPGGIGSSDTDTRSYDKRDFRGLWSRAPQQYDLGPCPECLDPVTWPGYGFFGETPPMTEEGKRRFEQNRPSRGLELGS